MNQTPYPQRQPPVMPPYQQPYPQQPYPQQGFAPPVAPPYAVAYPVRYMRDPRLTAATRTFNLLCLAVLMQTVFAMLFELPLVGLSRLLGVNVLADDVLYQLFLTAMVPLSTALPLLLFLKLSRRTAVESLRFEKVGFGMGLLCVLAGLGVCLLANYPAFFIQDLFSNFGYESASQFSHDDQTWLMLALEFFSTAILVPLMEEFAFRGVLLSSLRRYGAGFAVLASSVVFALVHMDFANVVFALIAGLVFGFLYVKTGNLWVTVCIHALNNGIAVLGNYEDLLFGSFADTADALLMYVPIAMGLVALALLAAIFRSRLFRKEEPRPWYDPSLSFGEGAGCVARAPLFWVIVVMMAAYTTSLFF